MVERPAAAGLPEVIRIIDEEDEDDEDEGNLQLILDGNLDISNFPVICLGMPDEEDSDDTEDSADWSLSDSDHESMDGQVDDDDEEEGDWSLDGGDDWFDVGDGGPFLFEDPGREVPPVELWVFQVLIGEALVANAAVRDSDWGRPEE